MIFILALISAAGSEAQTLQELIQTAMDNNYQIRIAQNESRIASNNNSAGNAGQLPSVDVNGSASTSLNSTRQEFADGSVREGSNARSSNIGASALVAWTVFDGFRVYTNKNRLGYLQSIGEVNAKFYIEQTISDLVMVYYQLLYEGELLNNFRQSVKISAYRLSVEEKRSEIGSGKGIEYRQALVDYRTDSIRCMAQQNKIRKLEIDLNRLLNGELEKAYNFTDTAFDIHVFPAKDTVLSRLEANNRQFEIQKLQELISESELRMERADRYPQVSLFAGYEYSESYSQVGFFSKNQNFGPIVGVRINFNLYDGGNTSREIRNARIEREISGLTREQVHQDLHADVLKLYRDHLSLRQRNQLAEENVNSMKGVYEIAATQLRRGVISGYDFRQTQLTLLNAELTLSQLRFNLKSSEISLNRLTGNILQAYL